MNSRIPENSASFENTYLGWFVSMVQVHAFFRRVVSSPDVCGENRKLCVSRSAETVSQLSPASPRCSAQVLRCPTLEILEVGKKLTGKIMKIGTIQGKQNITKFRIPISIDPSTIPFDRSMERMMENIHCAIMRMKL